MSEKIFNYLTKILDPESARLVLKMYKLNIPLTIRTNTLKISSSKLKERLESKGFKLREIAFIPDSFIVVEEPFPISKTLEHFAGFFYMQSLSSMLPSLALEPEPDEFVLDIASAPGSKTTHIAQLMKNTGIIIANDISFERLKVVAHQIERLGILNTAITSIDGNRFGNLLPEVFDRALVDAPCSALGIISKSNEVLTWWNIDEVRRLSNKQYQLLTSAIKSVKPDGVIVYSTCTLTVEENELMIDSVLKKFPLEIEEINYKTVDFDEGITFYDGLPLDERLKKAVRIYPFKSNTEGFFIARLRKTDSTFSKSPEFSDIGNRVSHEKMRFLTADDKDLKEALKFLTDEFGIDENIWSKFVYYFKNDEIWFCSPGWKKFLTLDFSGIDKNFKHHLMSSIIQRVGLKLAKSVKKAQWKISTSALQILSPFVVKNIIELQNEDQARIFINGGVVKNPDLNFRPGTYTAVNFDGITLGCGLVTKEGLKSQIPKGRRTVEVEVM
ncbi:16S rRNA (cytosine1407-C5)-methyltransferase [Candidatus Kryptobacter tengchongensis]|nr:16S rRNA (cytosine1407-C5)-methyltransferase [Candidatus Kryptobacter tengchongensis]